MKELLKQAAVSALVGAIAAALVVVLVGSNQPDQTGAIIEKLNQLETRLKTELGLTRFPHDLQTRDLTVTGTSTFSTTGDFGQDVGIRDGSKDIVEIVLAASEVEDSFTNNTGATVYIRAIQEIQSGTTTASAYTTFLVATTSPGSLTSATCVAPDVANNENLLFSNHYPTSSIPTNISSTTLASTAFTEIKAGVSLEYIVRNRWSDGDCPCNTAGCQTATSSLSGFAPTLIIELWSTSTPSDR